MVLTGLQATWVYGLVGSGSQADNGGDFMHTLYIAEPELHSTSAKKGAASARSLTETSKGNKNKDIKLPAVFCIETVSAREVKRGEEDVSRFKSF